MLKAMFCRDGASLWPSAWPIQWSDSGTTSEKLQYLPWLCLGFSIFPVSKSSHLPENVASIFPFSSLLCLKFLFS